MDAKRILKEIDVQFISLVGKGANGKQIIFKSDPHNSSPNFTKEIKLIKIDDDKRLVYGTVYEPDTVDSQGDVVKDAAVIEKAAHTFLSKLNNKNVDVQHDFVSGNGTVVESYILRSADPMFPDTKIGSWVVAIKIENDETWEDVKKGDIGGLSLAGLAVVEEVKKGIEAPTNKTEKSSGIKNFFSSLKSKFAEVKKDFNDELLADQLQQKVWALMDAIQNIMNDETITDKIPAVNASIEQFKASVAVNTNKSKTNEDDMKPEEVTKIVTDAVKAAVDPINEKITKFADDVKKANDRIEEVAKATPGSSQVLEEPVPVKKSKTSWLS